MTTYTIEIGCNGKCDAGCGCPDCAPETYSAEELNEVALQAERIGHAVCRQMDAEIAALAAEVEASAHAADFEVYLDGVDPIADWIAAQEKDAKKAG